MDTNKLQIRKLIVPDADPFRAYQFATPRSINGLSTINIFVGANNSGKSRLLRNLFRSRECLFWTDFLRGDEFARFLKDRNINTFNSLSADDRQRIEPFPGVVKEILDDHSSGGFRQDEPFYKQLQLVSQQMVQKAQSNQFGVSYSHWGFWNSVRDFYSSLHENLKERFEKSNFGDEARCYIPMLRGMRPVNGGPGNAYSRTTIDDYFGNMAKTGDALSHPFSIFTGLEMYDTLKNQLLGEPDDRAAVKQYEHFLQRRFFDNQPVTLIPRIGHQTVHVKIGSDPQLPIHALGDGLQSLITITFKIFMEKERCMFFMEEPDLSMHPGMQRVLLETMLDHSHHQYFLTTHSNHMLDMSFELPGISIYLFSKGQREGSTSFNVKQVSSPDVNILKELGVRNSSVFLTNATIWVEGLTDRLYLREFLKKFQQESQKKRYVEDYHYSFVEYQGSNLTHWTFESKDQSARIKANFLCAASLLIADGDVSNKGNRKSEYQEMLQDRFYILSCKEVENLLPEELVKQLARDSFARERKDVNAIKYHQYSNSEKGLGAYLDRKIGKNGTFGTKSGTLKNKVAFCEQAVQLMAKADFKWKLTPEIELLCDKIHKFIAAQNQ
jgi:hypothetical protein